MTAEGMRNSAIRTRSDDLPADPVIEAYKKDIDRTLLRQSLRLSVTERFEELMELQRFAEALRNAPHGARDDQLPRSA